MSSILKMRSPPPILPMLALGLGTACGSDSLSTQRGELLLEAMPLAGQQLLLDPIGVGLGEIATNGFGIARFRLSNPAEGLLTLEEVTLTHTSAVGELTLSNSEGEEASLPFVLRPAAFVTLSVLWRPQGEEGSSGQSEIEIRANDGFAGSRRADARITGSALDVGETQMELRYAGNLHRVPEDCDLSDPTLCLLPPFDLGFVGFNATQTGTLSLKNTPAEGDCRLPPLSDSIPNCNPACVLHFDRDPSEDAAVGIGIAPPNSDFSILGNLPLPFRLGPEVSECPPLPEIKRGAVELALRFQADDGNEGENRNEGIFVLESNLGSAPRVHVPLSITATAPPVAVAELRACGPENPPPQCSEAGSLAPLGRAFLDGRQSFDPEIQQTPT